MFADIVRDLFRVEDDTNIEKRKEPTTNTSTKNEVLLIVYLEN